MRSAAFVFGRTILYWDQILLVCAVLVCARALAPAWRANGGRRRALVLLVPLGTAMAFVCARGLYWACHAEQLGGFAAALRDTSASSFSLFGAVIGFALAVGLLRALCVTKDAALLLDCSAPALALGLALARLSALFNLSCRGKFVLHDPRFFRLPLAVAYPAADGGTEYRFAAFFAGALLLFLGFVLLLARYGRLYPGRGEPRGRKGDVFLSFLLILGAEELVIDSMRNDANFLSFNAFISMAQILAAAALLLVLIVYSCRAVRARGWRASFPLVWIIWTIGLSFVGVSEYLVQRHGDWYLSCYALMCAAIGLMLLCTAALRRAALRGRKSSQGFPANGEAVSGAD